jgi:hypothetical protein
MDEIQQRASALRMKMLANPEKYSADEIQQVLDMLGPPGPHPSSKLTEQASFVSPLYEAGAGMGIDETPHPSSQIKEQTSFLSTPKDTPLEQAIPEREAPPTVATDEFRQGQKRHFAHLAPNAQLSPEPPLPTPAMTPEESMPLEKAHDEWFNSLKDPKLQSASQMSDIYKPPTLIQPPKSPIQEAQGGSFLSMGQAGIDQARQGLPRVMGGNVEHIDEPSLEEFRRDMYPVLGPKVLKMNEEDEAYKQYADANWMRAYNRAQQEGRSTVRTKYAMGETPTMKAAESAFTKAATGLASVPGVGAAAAAVTGNREERERLMSENPISSTVGQIGGGLLMPFPAATAATGLGRIAQTAGAAGLFGAGTTAADEALGATPTSARKVLAHGGEAGLTGLGLGTLFGGIGEGAEKLRPKSVALEKARPYAETSVLHGMVPGPEISRLESEVKGLGLEPKEAMIPHAIEKSRPAVTRQLQTEEEAAKFKHGTETTEYNKLTENYRPPAQQLFDAAVESHASTVGPDGRPLTVGPEESTLRRVKNLVADVKSPKEHYEVIRPLEPGEDALLAQAKEMYGPDVAEKIAASEDKIKEALGKGGAGKGGDIRPVGAPGPIENTAAARGREAATTPAGKQAAPADIGLADTLSPQTPKGFTHWGDVTPESYPIRPNKIYAEQIGLPKLADAEFMHASEARKLGVNVDPKIPDDATVLLGNSNKNAPPGGKLMGAGEARAQGFDVPRHIDDADKVVITPRKMNPAELHEATASIDEMAKNSRIPHVEELQRAARQVRDQFPEIGPVVGKRATIEDLGTGQKTELKGYSAHQHEYSEASKARALTRQRTGIPESPNADAAATFRNATTRTGESPAEVADRAAAWQRAGQGDALKFVEGLRAYQGLAGKKLRVAPFAAMRGSPFALQGDLSRLGLHLDPILANRFRFSPSATRLAGAGARPTFDEINRLLNVMPQEEL